MDLNIATAAEAAVLKRALYARMAVVHGAMHAASRMNDMTAHRVAQVEEHALYILTENVIQIELSLRSKEAPVDMDAMIELQRPG